MRTKLKRLHPFRPLAAEHGLLSVARVLRLGLCFDLAVVCRGFGFCRTAVRRNVAYAVALDRGCIRVGLHVLAMVLGNSVRRRIRRLAGDRRLGDR